MTVAATAQKMASTISGTVARLKTIWTPLARVLTFSLADDTIAPAKNVSVSISRGRVSVAYGTRVLSRIRMKGFKTYPMEDRYPTPEGLASTVSMALSSLHASGTGVTLCIPKAWAVVKTVEFPSSVRDNLPDVVSYEMDRLTPFTREEALYDFRILQEDGGRLSLVLVAARADLINPYIKALGERGFDVRKVIMNLSGLGTVCSYSHKCEDGIFFRLGENEYEAALFSGGLIAAVRAGSLGTEDEKSRVNLISGEIRMLMEEAKKRGVSPQVILSLKSSSPTLREMLKLSMNATFKVFEEGGSTFGLPSGEIPYDAVGGVLESLRPGTRGLNFLRKGVQEKVRTPLTLSVMLVAAILIIWGVSLFVPVDVEKKRLEEIQSEIAARKEEVRKVEALRKESDTLESEIAVISNFKGARPSTLDLVKELTGILPKKTWLSRVRITETTVEIEGYSASATELLPKLEASKYFKKVEFASPTFRDVRMNYERFVIKMEIEGAKKMEVNKPEESKQSVSAPATAPAPAAAPAKGGKVKK